MFENHRKEKWIILAFLFVLAIVGFLLFCGLQAKATNKDKFLDIQNITTKDGISVWLVEDHTLPIIALTFMFKDSGSSLDPQEKQGLARMASNVMDEGAGDLDSQNFQKSLSDHSIKLKFDANRDNFGGEVVTLSRHKEKAFDLLSMAINGPRFDEEPLGRMRDANISRIKSSLAEPDWIAARIMNDKAFENNPYAKNSGGTISGLKNISRDDLIAFKKENLTKDKLIITASGDITPQELSNAIDKIFGELPKSNNKMALKNAVLSNPSKIFLYKKDIPQTFFEVLLPTFDDNHPDHYALQVLNYIYGGAGFGSRLMETAREKRGLTYGIYSNLLSFDYAYGLSISTSTKNESAHEMLSIIKEEMLKLQSTPVSQKQLDDAKSYITGSMPLALKSTKDIAQILLGLKNKEKPIDYLDTYSEKINAVTIDDIQRVAKDILKPENMVVVLVGNPQKIENVQIVESLPNVE